MGADNKSRPWCTFIVIFIDVCHRYHQVPQLSSINVDRMGLTFDEQKKASRVYGTVAIKYVLAV